MNSEERLSEQIMFSSSKLTCVVEKNNLIKINNPSLKGNQRGGKTTRKMPVENKKNAANITYLKKYMKQHFLGSKCKGSTTTVSRDPAGKIP